MMNGGPSFTNFAINAIERLAELSSRPPNLNNLQQALEHLTGEQWRFGQQHESADELSATVSRNDESNHDVQSKQAENDVLDGGITKSSPVEARSRTSYPTAGQRDSK